MFSGKIPFQGVQLDELPLHLETGERPFLPADHLSRHRGLSAEMEDLIQDCWTQDPTKRPSADTVVERLKLLPNRPVDQRLVNDIGTSFFMRLLGSQVDNPFAVLRREYHRSVGSTSAGVDDYFPTLDKQILSNICCHTVLSIVNVNWRIINHLYVHFSSPFQSFHAFAVSSSSQSFGPWSV